MGYGAECNGAKYKLESFGDEGEVKVAELRLVHARDHPLVLQRTINQYWPLQYSKIDLCYILHYTFQSHQKYDSHTDF